MSTQKFVTLSLILSFIYLVYVILDYYGYVRYTTVHLFPPNSYIKNYTKLSKADSDCKVVVSMTTTPSGLKHLKPVINSLLDQTVRIDLISITVPYGDQYALPENLKKCVQLYRCGRNYGCANSLIPAAMREGEKNTKIITVGDNKIYGKDFIETLINTSKKNKNCIVWCGEKFELGNGALFTSNMFSEKIVNMSDKDDCQEWLKKSFKNIKKINVIYQDNFTI